MKATAFFTVVIAAVLVAILTITLVKATSPKPQPAVNPLCTVAAINALSDYWNAQIASATYVALQNTEANAVVAMAARVNYCKAHA
jgi:hypothetical protein